MSALKTNVKKFLAAFLCVGLLLSYNPAFGAVDAAFADETAQGSGNHLKNDMPTQENLDKQAEAWANDDSARRPPMDATTGGEAETIVKVSTYDSTLRTARCDSFSATVDQLAGGSANDQDIRYLWYEVTGGTPSEGADPYSAEWTAYVNDEPDADINKWLKDHPITPDVKDNVANYHLDIQSIAIAGLLQPNKKYTFVVIFEDSLGSKALERVTVYTVNNGVVDFQHKVIQGTGELTGVEIEGMVSVKPKVPELVGGKVPPTNPIKDAMEEKAAKATMDEADKEDGGNYVVKEVLQINTDPMYIPGGNGLDIPPFDEDGFILRLPIDPDSGYKDGDTVTVLWSGDDSGEIKEITATVRPVPNETGKLQVEIPYPYWKDVNPADGKDDSGWPPLPGYFAIQYDTNKADDSSGIGGGKAQYFTITASATGSGIVTPEGEKIWRVNTSALAGDAEAAANLADTSALDQAVYGFAPLGLDDEAYELRYLTLTCQEGLYAGRSFNLLSEDGLSDVHGKLSALNTTLTLTNDPSVFSPNSKWTLLATFGNSTMSGDDAKRQHRLTVKSDNPEYGKVAVAYHNESQELAMRPEGNNGNTEAAGEIQPFLMPNGSKALVVMVPKSSTDKKYYQVTGISMKVGSGDFEPQALSRPFVVPATTDDVVVVVSFGEYDKVPGWGGSNNYTVIASVAADDAELGSVVKTDPDSGELVPTGEYTVEYGENNTFVPNILFQGVDDDKYLSSVDLYVGERTEPEHVQVNAATDPLFTLILPNYHADMRVEGHFTDKKASTIKLSIEVRTIDEANEAGGGWSPLAWTPVTSGVNAGKVRSGQRCPMLITPNDGYVLDNVTERVGDKNAVELPAANTQGNVWNYMVPPDNRDDKSEVLPIVLTITFKKASNGGGDNANKLYRLNTYVADAAYLNNDFNLGYAFKAENNKLFVDGQQIADASTVNLSPEGYSERTGLVNGRSSTFDTVKYGANHILNFKGGELNEKTYGIQKLLVVKYYFTTEDGVQVKKATSWNLYTTSIPVFELTNITTHTDVFAYFAPTSELSGGYNDAKDYCTVKVSSTPEGLVQPSAPEKGVQVLKGSSLPVRFTMSNAEYVIDDATVKKGDTTERHITGELRALAGSASSVTYTVPNITDTTVVTATYEPKPDDQVVRHGVSTKVLVKGIDDEVAKPLEQGASQPARVSVLFGAGYGQNAQLVNGAVPGVRLVEGTNMQFALSRTSSYNKLTNLAFTWESDAVKAYVTKTTVDGVEQNIIHFTTDEADLVGRQLYTKDTPLYGEGNEPENVRTEQSWYASNLLCDITVVPTYQKLPRPEAPDTGDNWILTTLVGKGFGQVLVNKADATGCMKKVPKNSVNSKNAIEVSFVPAAGYRVSGVHVETSTGDLLNDFWLMVEGVLAEWFGYDIIPNMERQAVEDEQITLLRMVSNYTITVDFEPIEDQVSPGTSLPDHVAVNVMYDSDKGSVTPDTGLVVNRNAQQQFTVTPAFETDEDDNKTFYSVKGVRVCFGDDVVDETNAGDTTSAVVRWNGKFDNVFVVDFSKVQWPPDQLDAAITVEVLFSDEPDVPQINGSGGDGDGDGDDGNVPGTPTGDQVKLLTVNVVTEGDEPVGSNGIGGIVSPLGTMELVPSEDGTPYLQRIDVLPGDDYVFDHLDVILNGEDVVGNPLWYQYMLSLKEENKGYFEVTADGPGTEVITVYFTLKKPEERSYTITMEASIPDADRFIQPVGSLTLLNTQSQSYSIDPDLNYWVKSITDEAFDAEGNPVTLPVDADGKRGVNWERDEGDEQAINEVTIKPIRVNGKAVNRRVVVTFEPHEGVDHGIVKSEKVNLHVDAWGPGKEYVTFEPNGDSIGVFKGTETKRVSYTYSYSLSQEGIDAGYGIYRVTANGETVFGSPDNRTNIRYEGSFVFDNDNLTRETNNLYVYVRKATTGGPVDPGTNPDPGTDPDPGTTPDNPDNPDNPSHKYVTVDYGCGNGGTIADRNPSSRVSRATDESAGGQLTGSLQVDPEEPFVLMITPKEGYVVDRIIMDNCYVIEPLWVAPEDDREARIALEATMMVEEASMPARVLATFVKGDPNSFKPWDPTLEDGDGHAFNVDGALVVEISPAAGVEALIEFENDDARAADMLDVSDPVAPFTPKATKKTSGTGDSASYTVTYDTISELSDAENVRILVGPLINWNDDDNEKSTLYAIESVDGLKDVQITEKPLPNTPVIEEGVVGEDLYYTYYEIRGALDDGTMETRNVSLAAEGADADVATQAEGAASSRPVSKVNIGLRNIEFAKGFYPEYMSLSRAQTLKLEAVVVGGEGAIVPTAVTVGTSWYDGNLTGPWYVAPNSVVSFKVAPGADYVLNALSYDSADALSNGSFNTETDTLTFRMTIPTTVYAQFVHKDSSEALRTVNIEIVPSKDGAIHGSTSPPPGENKAQKGQPFQITFRPYDGYEPYLIWVDGQGSRVDSGTTGWLLPKWWHNQTFRVQYEPVGTTPDLLDDVKLNIDNATSLVRTGLVATGDNPWLPMVVLLVALAGGAAFIGTRMVHASQAADRRAKYSVTKREEPKRREEDDTEE